MFCFLTRDVFHSIMDAVACMRYNTSISFSVNLDATTPAGGQDKCNGVVYLTKDNSSQVEATERVSHGYCDVTFKAISDVTNHCSSLCFTPKSDACESDIDLSIVVFSLEDKNNAKVGLMTSRLCDAINSYILLQGYCKPDFSITRLT